MKIDEPGWSVDEAWSPSGRHIALSFLEHHEDGYHYKNVICNAFTGATLVVHTRMNAHAGDETSCSNFVPIWSASGHRCFLPLQQCLVAVHPPRPLPASELSTSGMPTAGSANANCLPPMNGASLRSSEAASLPIPGATESSILSPCGTLLVECNVSAGAVYHHHVTSAGLVTSMRVFKLLRSYHSYSRSATRRPEIAWLGMAQQRSLIYATCALSDEHVYIVNGSTNELLHTWHIPHLLGEVDDPPAFIFEGNESPTV